MYRLSYSVSLVITLIVCSVLRADGHVRTDKRQSKECPELRTIHYLSIYVHPHNYLYTTTQTRGYFAHDAFEALKYDNSYDFDKFKNEMDIKITAVEHDRLEFDLIGVDAPVANAFRRILLSEVPTMAIDKVVLYQNTSIIQDEVLAHRYARVSTYV